MKKLIIALSVLSMLSVLSISLAKTNTNKDDGERSKMITRLWSKRVRYYDFQDNKYLISRVSSNDYTISTVDYFTGRLNKILSLRVKGYRVHFEIEDDKVYIVYQIKDYPVVQQTVECISLETGKVIWSVLLEECKATDPSDGSLIIANEKLVFVQMGMANDDYDMIFFHKKDGKVLNRVKLNGYNYFTRPLIVKDDLFIATTNHGLGPLNKVNSFLSCIDLKKMEVNKTIDVPGIIKGLYVHDEKIFNLDKKLFVGSLIPGRGYTLYKVQENLSKIIEINTKVNVQDLYKHENRYFFSGVDGIGFFDDDCTIEYLEYLDFKIFRSKKVNNYLLYWPPFSLYDLKTNEKVNLSIPIYPVLSWYIEDQNILLVLLEKEKHKYTFEAYRLNL